MYREASKLELQGDELVGNMMAMWEYVTILEGGDDNILQIL
jgi:hypothetical protein